MILLSTKPHDSYSNIGHHAIKRRRINNNKKIIIFVGGDVVEIVYERLCFQ